MNTSRYATNFFVDQYVSIRWSWYICFNFRETTDTYTIAASPSFGYLGPSTSKYSLLDLGRSGLGSDLKLPLVSDKADGKQDSVKTLPKTLGSIRDERVSFQLQHTGELYITQGCNVTQTVFNGTTIWIQKCSTCFIQHVWYIFLFVIWQGLMYLLVLAFFPPRLQFMKLDGLALQFYYVLRLFAVILGFFWNIVLRAKMVSQVIQTSERLHLEELAVFWYL
jgi:hypothetical protein